MKSSSVLLSVCFGALLISFSQAQMMPGKQDMAEDGMAKSGANPGPSSTLTFAPKFSKLLDASELQKLKVSPLVGTVYFYKKDTSEWDKNFLASYDKSAEFLNAYGLTLGLVDCSGAVPKELEEECSLMSEKIVYTYRNGDKILNLEVANMFDVDSIMSNILLLVLMDEMLIVQSKESRMKLEHDNAGQKDMVFTCLNYVGTYESRVFMEIAYAYQDKYKFAMTSELVTTSDLQDADVLLESSDSSACIIWVLYCRERYDPTSGCRSVNYRGRVNLIDLARFFKQLDWPRVVHRTEGSSEKHPCEMSDDVGCVIISYSPAGKKRADKLVESLQFDLHGLVGLIVHERNAEDRVDDPQVIIQKPHGKNVTVNGRLELAMIESMIAFHLLPDIEKRMEESYTEEDDSEEASQIDDMVVKVANQQRQSVSDFSHLPVLTDKTFPALTRHSELTIVLFYIPFDAQGMVFLLPFQEAGVKLAALKGQNPSAHPLARVNCFDWTDVCQKENITSYPVIYIYRDGRRREQYRHALDTDVIVRTVMLLQAEQPLMLNSEEEVTDFLAGQLPKQAYSTIDNLVLLKLSAKRKEMKAYKAVVREMETQMLFAIVGPEVKTSFVPNGGVLHKRTKDHNRPMEILTENLDAASIISFLRKGQFSVFPELTFMNFPALYARKQPFGILFYEPSLPGVDDIQQTIVTHLLANKEQDMIFCKMTVGDSNPEAKPLLLNYTQTEDLPAFAIVNHHKGAVYVLQDREMKPSAVLPWIQAVQSGEVVPSKMLEKGEWKPPGQHYDFLAIMDKEKQMKGKKKQSEASEYVLPEDESDEQEEQDIETRANLLELQQSRLYHGKDRKMHASAGPMESTTTTTMDSSTADMETKKSQHHPQHTEL